MRAFLKSFLWILASILLSIATVAIATILLMNQHDEMLVVSWILFLMGGAILVASFLVWFMVFFLLRLIRKVKAIETKIDTLVAQKAVEAKDR